MRWKDVLVIVKPETVVGWHRRWLFGSSGFLVVRGRLDYLNSSAAKEDPDLKMRPWMDPTSNHRLGAPATP
jgi:hypothetical protein